MSKEAMTWDTALSDWLNAQFNDTYAICYHGFMDGIRIVDHPANVSNDNFIRLIRNILPVKKYPVPFSITEENFTLFVCGEQVIIKPYDNEVHHTAYVKEEV